jgi:excisionase family DNA binding protein
LGHDKRTWANLPASDNATFLTLMETADFLRVPDWTLRKMLQRGEFPPGVVAKVGRSYRFSRPGLEKWIAAGGAMAADNAARPRR